YVAPLTAFTHSGELDDPALRDNIDQFVDMGLHGIVVGGFIAEAWNLTLSEWYHYHEVIAEAVAGRIDISTIILDPSARQALEKMRAVEKMGYRSAEVMNPAVQLKSDDEIYSFYKYLADRTDMAMILYRTAVSGTVLSLELMQRLADIETIVGVKQGSLKRSDTVKLRREIRDDFFISEPIEQYFYDDLRAGYPFIQWAAYHFTTYGKKRSVILEYKSLAEAGKWDQAYQVWSSLRDVAGFVEDMTIWELAKTGTYASAFAILKPWYDAIGLNGGYTLAPVEDVSAERREWLVDQLQSLGIA
ncbi:MAG: dihydrodipicolinate synthase family protein, partial [Gammaproteobacteria bacterium]